jgi:hypothetical protein
MTGAEPPPAPLMHTPSKRVGFVPQGQSAEAGDATTRGAATKATAQPKTSTPRFTLTI